MSPYGQMCGGLRESECFAKCMARITTLCVFIVPFFSEAGRKSNRVLSTSKLLENFFYSAAEAAWSDAMGSEERCALRCRRRVSLRGVVFSPFRSILKERFYFRLGSANVVNILKFTRAALKKN